MIFCVVFEIAINKIIDFNFRIFSEIWATMSIKNADGIGFNGVELFADETIFARIVGLILQSFNPLIDTIPSENVLGFFRCCIFIFKIIDFFFFLMRNIKIKFIFWIVSLLNLLVKELEFRYLFVDWILCFMHFDGIGHF